jgi:hypothetical protein
MLKNRFGEFHFPAHNEFFGYFVKQWLENEEISVVLWRCCHRRHRTDNAVGGCNNKVNSYFERSHPNIKKIIGLPTKIIRKLKPHIQENDIKFRGEEKKEVLY